MEMKMKNRSNAFAGNIVCCCLIAFMLLISGGCSSLKVIETWNKPTLQAHKYQKILVLGVARDEGKRATFENLVADELGRRDVQAVPANTIIPFLDMDNTTRSAVVAAVKKSGCDAVLTTRAMAAGETNVVRQEGQSAYVYGANAMASHYDFLRATLQTSMYDVATGELLWSATISTFDAHKVPRVSRDLGEYFFSELRGKGLL